MKHKPEEYAEAFVLAISGDSAKREHVLKTFLTLIRKNGDWPGIEKIYKLIAKKITENGGGQTVILEFARELPKSIKDMLLAKFSNKDFLDVKINPKLVAGARILVNGEKELDSTLLNKLNKLFS